MMICNECAAASECDWYASYKRIQEEVQLGIGTSNVVGMAIKEAIESNHLTECEYFETDEES